MMRRRVKATQEEHDGEVDGIAEDALDTQDDTLEAPGQTFRQVDLSDPEQFKSLGGKPAAIIAAHLPIEGRLHSTVRGKELMLGIANVSRTRVFCFESSSMLD